MMMGEPKWDETHGAHRLYAGDSNSGSHDRKLPTALDGLRTQARLNGHARRARRRGRGASITCKQTRSLQAILRIQILFPSITL